MTVKEKLIYFSERGVSIAYISKRMNVDASTLTKWIKGQKGITHKNEELLNLTLKEIAKELFAVME